MTGTLECSAKFSSLLCLSVLRAMQSTILDSTLEVSSIGSPLPSCESELFKNIEDPPIWVMATSNAARVLVEDFSKTNPNVFLDTFAARLGSFFSSVARSTIPRTSAIGKSFNVRKCCMVINC